MPKFKNTKKERARVNDSGAPVVREERVYTASLTVAVVAVILAINVLIYILATSLGWYIMPKERDEIVLTGATDSLFESAAAKDLKVVIYFCNDKESIENHDTGAFVHKTATEFKKRYPNLLDIEYINLITRLNSKGERVDMNRLTDGGKTNLLRTSVIFDCESTGKHKVVTDYVTNAGYADFFTLDGKKEAISYDGEEFMAAMIAYVQRAEHKKAYFTVTHSEQIDPAFSKLLVVSGYEVDTVNLREGAVPEDADLVIISNPKNDFQTSTTNAATTEIGRLRAYLDRGGSIYVSLDPFVKKLYSLEAFLLEYGIGLSETEVDGEIIRDIVRDSQNAITTNGYTIVTEHADGALSTAIKENMDKYSNNDVIVREAGALTLLGTAQALLTSSSTAVCENGGVVTREGGDFPVAAYNRLAVGGGDGEANVFVVSSIYLSVSSAMVTNGYSNKDFLYSVMEEVFGATALPYGCRSVLYETDTLENLTLSTANLYTAIVIAVPVVIAVCGAVIVIRRKNR